MVSLSTLGALGTLGRFFDQTTESTETTEGSSREYPRAVRLHTLDTRTTTPVQFLEVDVG